MYSTPRQSAVLLLSAASLLASTLLTGCYGMVESTGGGITITEPTGTGTAKLAGEVFGGQAALVGAHVYALSSNVTANAGPGITGATTNASTSLIAATPYVTGYVPTADASGAYYIKTDSAGFYEISSTTPCTPGSITYLYSVQGIPGSGSTPNNTAAGEMVALGVCPTTGTNAGKLIGSLKAGASHIHMNEISTVAAAYALAGYASDVTHIGAAFGTASGTSPALTYADTLAVTGIQNAVNNAAQLYNYNYNTASSGTGDPGAIANATTPNGNGTVPQTTIDSLGNSLAACVNTTATAGSCTNLFAAATSTGTTSGTKPTDTATAAINIAHYPALNVATIYNNAPTTGAAFGTTLTAQPNDWSVGIIFTGGGLGKNTTDLPHGIAVDAAGNVWAANSTSTILSEVSPLGVPLSSTGYTVGTHPYSVALDISGNAWTANYGSSTLTKVTSAGSPTTYSTGLNLNAPSDLEFSYSGNLWVVEPNVYDIKLIPPAATSVTKNNTNNSEEPYAIALESGSTGYAYTADEFYQIDYNTSTDTGGIAAYSSTTYEPFSVAVDGSNRAWVGENEAYLALLAAPGGGTPTEYEIDSSSQSYYADLYSVAIDGSGHPWMTDQANGDIAEANTADSAVLSGTYGFLAAGNTQAQSGLGSTPVRPNSLAVDGSGDVWYTTTTDSTIRELIGIATPVATPIVYGVVNSKLGSRP